ncbi:MAG: flagellar basal body L-ring protein FlgH, partial [Pseudomonadota bacterium]
RLQYIFFISLVMQACASTPEQVVEDEPSYTGRDMMLTEHSTPTSASLWNQAPESLFGNRRARAIGDILTVVVEIDEEAEIDNSVDKSRSNQDNFSVRALFGAPSWAQNTLPGGATLDPGVDFSRDKSVSNSGSIKREDKITLRLAARVVEMLPNGYMVIRGEQRVRVNYEERVLRAEGIIRPEDISRSNTVPHDRIAEAKIGYVGQGEINRTVKPRLGNRVLDAIIPF